jgi:hypothetical protein
LSPVQKSGEFYPLDSGVDAKPHEKPIEVRLHGATRHVELTRDFRVVAALQQQFSDLLLTRPQPDKLLVHPKSSPSLVTNVRQPGAEQRPPGETDLALPLTKVTWRFVLQKSIAFMLPRFRFFCCDR